MSKTRLIRLIIYLIVALLLIALLWVLSKNKEPKIKEEKNVEEGITVNLPTDSIQMEDINSIEVTIDSVGNYIIYRGNLTLDELNKELVVLSNDTTKPLERISVYINPMAPSKYFMDLVKLANELKISIGFKKL